jgi:hypothetical protein
MFGRKALFWLAVGGTACLAPFVLRTAADKIPSDGLKKFVAYINSAPGGTA